MCLIRRTDQPDLLHQAVREAADLLRSGQLVAVPTETVYGLAANALNVQAVQKIFTTKGRPANNPLIVHVCSLQMARGCAREWPDLADRLAKSFWPGPLTMVLPKAASIPAVVTAHGDTVGIRWPSHAVIQAVIEACGFPLAAPSANLSGCISPTTAEHVRRSLGQRIPLILDGGSAAVGIESTVLDLTQTPPRILRPGTIHEESLAAVIGPDVQVGQEADGPLRSPGLLPKHYAPKAKVLIWEGADSASLRTEIRGRDIPDDRIHILSRTPALSAWHTGPVSAMPKDPASFAKALYAELHRCDELGAALIVVEAVPVDQAWRGIADRLRRAAA